MITHEVSLHVREENFKILLETLVKVVKGKKIDGLKDIRRRQRII